MTTKAAWAPAAAKARVRSMVPAVEFVPVPAMTGTRSPNTMTARRTSSPASAKVTVGDSPVVPTTTMTSVPCCACHCSSPSQACRSISPASVIGVTTATMLPLNTVTSPRAARATDGHTGPMGAHVSASGGTRVNRVKCLGGQHRPRRPAPYRAAQFRPTARLSRASGRCP